MTQPLLSLLTLFVNIQNISALQKPKTGFQSGFQPQHHGTSTMEFLQIQTDTDFEQVALKTFQHQATHCSVYSHYLQLRGIRVESVEIIPQIPFLPVEFFKTASIRSGDFEPAVIFSSSTTVGTVPSRHAVRDLAVYEQSYLRHFTSVFGDPSQYVIIGLLPSYLERPDSSLVAMVHGLMQRSGKAENAFFRTDFPALRSLLERLKREGKKYILFGVSFALLDFAADGGADCSGNIVLETGGMKGRKKEMTRDELHAILCDRLHIDRVHSEYGMTELLSQAYSLYDGRFQPPPWMTVAIRDLNDPAHLLGHGPTGGVNIIDLANIDSCAFLATDDLGRTYADGSFEILGRTDASDIRGCSLLVADAPAIR